MSDFNKDEYLNDLPDMDNLSGQTAPPAPARRRMTPLPVPPSRPLPIRRPTRHRLRVPPPLQTPKTPLPTTP